MLKSLLVPTDFSPGSDKALQFAVELATPFRAHVYLVHIGAVVDDAAQVHSARRDIYHKAREEQERIARKRMQNVIDRLEADHPELTFEAILRSGAPHDVICRLAEEQAVDLIVMGTSGLTGISHFLISSTAERVVRVSSVPVLTVRAT